MKLTEDEMWQASVTCDKTYDGRFFYAVKTVGVYCRPSCKSRTPLRKNVRFFLLKQGRRGSGIPFVQAMPP